MFIGIILAIAVTVAVFVSAIGRTKLKSERIHCVRNLKHLTLRWILYLNSNDHPSIVPPNLLTITNEIADPRMFVCPSDKARRNVTNFSALQAQGSSYHFDVQPFSQEPLPLDRAQNHILLRCDIHLNVAMADGSVHMVTPEGLTNLLELSQTGQK